MSVDNVTAQAAQARRINDSQPIFRRIPVELLSLIASFIPPDFQERGAPGKALSHACTRWRQIALSCRDLWAEIPLQHPEWTQMCLDRSQSALITITVKGDLLEQGSPYFHAATLALSQLKRIRNLDISTYGDEDAGDILVLLSQSAAPHLEELYLTFFDLDLDCIDVPLDIFSGETPSKLRILEAFACKLPFNSPILRSESLTSVELTRSDIWDTVDEMVETLSHFHNIETFHLECCVILPDTTPSSTHAPRSVRWPHLTYLSAGDIFSQVITLFHYLHLPQNLATLSLHGAGSEQRIPDGIRDIVINSLAQHFAPLSDAGLTCTRVRLYLSRETYVVDADWSDDAIAYDDISPSYFPRQNSASFTIPRWSWGVEGARKSREVLMGIMDFLPFFTRTKAFFITADDDFLKLPDEWRVLTHFTHVETVQISGSTAFALMAWLDVSHNSLHSVFPSLRTLRFQGVNFQQESRAAGPSAFDCMLAALGSSSLPKRVERVEIHGSDVSEDKVATLRRLLGEDGVIWDGETEPMGGAFGALLKRRAAKRASA